MGKLAENLVMPAGIQLHLQQEVALCGLDEGILELGLLAVFGNVRLVLGFVANQIVRKSIALFRGPIGGEGPIGLVDFSLAEHLVQALQGLGSFGKEHHAAHGAV